MSMRRNNFQSTFSIEQLRVQYDGQQSTVGTRTEYKKEAMIIGIQGLAPNIQYTVELVYTSLYRLYVKVEITLK